MKLLASTLILLSVQAWADFDGAKINIGKFESEAKKELSALGLKDHGATHFQDGAWSTDMEPLFDGASLFYVSENTFSLNNQILNISYELKLIDGSVHLRLTSLAPGFRDVFNPNNLIITLQDDLSPNGFQEAVAALKLEFPEATIQELAELGIIVARWPNTDLVRIKSAISIIQSKINPLEITMDLEAYRLPIDIGVDQVTGNGVIDVDKLRDVVPVYLNMGLSFTTKQSMIPARFQ